METATVLQLTPTWKPSFVLPYESDWSIREKFSFMNVVAPYTVKVCKIENLRASTAEETPFINQLKSSHHSQFMDDSRVRVCPECIKYGYHSYLHQQSFCDNCFIHKDTKLKTIDTYVNTTSYAPNYYDTNHTTTAKNVVNNGQLLKEIIKVRRNFTNNTLIQYIVFNELNVGNGWKYDIYNSTKTLLRSCFFSQTSNTDDVRTVLSVAKKDIREVTEKAVNELSDKTSLDYFNELRSRERLHWYTGAYLKTLIDDFISSEFNSENEYCHEVSIIDACEEYGKLRQHSKIDRYAKVITIIHIINSRVPHFYHKLQSQWNYPPSECYHPISIANEISHLVNRFYLAIDGSEPLTNPVVYVQALLKDIFNDTSSRLAAKIQSGEFDIFDDMMISRANFYIPTSQYILMDEVDKVTLYACKPD